MADNLKEQLFRWGINLHLKNVYGNYREIKVKSLEREEELVFHDMLALNVQWIECDVIDQNGLTMPDKEHMIVTGVEGNGVIKPEDLPVLILPKVSYDHQVKTEIGPILYPLIYAYDLKPTSTPTPDATALLPPQPGAACSHSHPHDLIRQLQIGQDNDVQPKLFKEEFRLTGCNMRQTFQSTLKLCRTHMLNKIELPVRVQPEPTNPVDRNAIAFQVFMPEDNLWKTVGYVAVEKITKVRAAYDNQEITKLTVKVPKYGHSARIPGYFSYVHITKKKKWLPNDPTNIYLKP